MLGLWLGELLRHVDGLKLKEVEDLVQVSKSCGWECPHEMPLLVLRRRMAEETNVWRFRWAGFDRPVRV